MKPESDEPRWIHTRVDLRDGSADHFLWDNETETGFEGVEALEKLEELENFGERVEHAIKFNYSAREVGLYY